MAFTNLTFPALASAKPRMLLCVLGGAKHFVPPGGATKIIVEMNSMAATRQAAMDKECDVLIVDPSNAFGTTKAWAIRLGFAEEQIKHGATPSALLPDIMTATPAFYYLKADATTTVCQQFFELYTRPGGGGICFINDIAGTDFTRFWDLAGRAIKNFQGQLGDPKPETVSWSTATRSGFTFIRPSHPKLPTNLGYVASFGFKPLFMTRFASTIVKLHRRRLYVHADGRGLNEALELDENTAFDYIDRPAQLAGGGAAHAAGGGGAHVTPNESYFSVSAEELYWQDNPFRADDCPDSNSITNWWTRIGIGAQTINMFCRKGIHDARTLARQVLEQLQGQVQNDGMFAQVSADIDSDLRHTDTHTGSLFEKRLMHAVGCLHTYTTLGRVRVQPLQAITIRRAPLTDVKVGAIIEDWANQFVSVTPYAEKGMHDGTRVGYGELKGDYYQLVWPKGVATIRGWYINDREMVLPMGCTFEILAKLPGSGRWRALVRMPKTYHPASPRQALALPPPSSIRAAKGTSILEAYLAIASRPLKQSKKETMIERQLLVAPLLADRATAVATAIATIEDIVFREMTSKRDTPWAYKFAESTPGDVLATFKHVRNLTYFSGVDLSRNPHKEIRQLLNYYYHIEHLVDSVTFAARVNNYNGEYHVRVYPHAPVGEAAKYAAMRIYLWQSFSSTPKVIEPAIAYMKAHRPSDDGDSMYAQMQAKQIMQLYYPPLEYSD